MLAANRLPQKAIGDIPGGSDDDISPSGTGGSQTPGSGDVELDREELSTKFDEANQTIGALRFKNNFLAEKTKKLEAELVQVRA